MIYQPPKYHSNSFSHFLQLHSSINNNSTNNNNNNNRQNQQSPSDDDPNDSKLDMNDDTTSNASNTSLEVVNESMGKSFTIAAILGLKKNSNLQSRGHCDLDDNATSIMNDYNSNFHSNIINLTKSHSKLFQKFDNNDNHRNSYMLGVASTEHSQMEQQQCNASMYENNTTNSSYQEHHHLHKQQQTHNINSEFNANYSRNSNIIVDDTTNPVMRNHLHHHHHHHSANLLNKTFNRERGGNGNGRVGEHFSSKSKSSMSLKNKRVRTIFTPEQLERLEAEFERQQYMVGPERLYLAHTLQLTEAQVKVWFQNRRIKWRKHHLEITQQHLAIARQRQLPLPQIPNTSKEEDSQSAGEQIVSDADD